MTFHGSCKLLIYTLSQLVVPLYQLIRSMMNDDLSPDVPRHQNHVDLMMLLHQ